MGAHRDQSWRTQWLPLVLAALGVGGLLAALLLVSDGKDGADVASGFTTAPTPSAAPTPELSAEPTDEPSPTVSASPRNQPPISRTTPPARTPAPTTSH
ncbi:MAG: hypothetical protein IRZ08_17570 [Frankia sp.]|nr:hypothetical protein [Frankia sp.]